MTKYWTYLFIAAIFEAAWTFSLKFLDLSALKKFTFVQCLTIEGIYRLFPLLGYIVFGIANTYFFAISTKQIPMASAMAVWMALSLVFIKIAEFLFFAGKFSWMETFFLMLIAIGIVGLKVVSK